MVATSKISSNSWSLWLWSYLISLFLPLSFHICASFKPKFASRLGRKKNKTTNLKYQLHFFLRERVRASVYVRSSTVNQSHKYSN